MITEGKESQVSIANCLRRRLHELCYSKSVRNLFKGKNLKGSLKAKRSNNAWEFFEISALLCIARNSKFQNFFKFHTSCICVNTSFPISLSRSKNFKVKSFNFDSKFQVPRLRDRDWFTLNYILKRPAQRFVNAKIVGEKDGKGYLPFLINRMSLQISLLPIFLPSSLPITSNITIPLQCMRINTLPPWDYKRDFPWAWRTQNYSDTQMCFLIVP